MDKPIVRGLKITFLVHFIVALIFGLVFLIVPQLWTRLAGVPMTSFELYRLIGAAILAFGLSSFLAYIATYWASVRILVLTEIAWSLLATVLLLYYLVRWHFPGLYWLPAILMAGFATAFGFFYDKNK